VGIIECRGGGIAVGISVSVPVCVSIAPVPVLSIVVVAIPVLIPGGILVLVPVRIIGGAEADELAYIGLLDNGLPTILQRQFGDGIGARAESPWSGRTTILDDSNHLIGAIGSALLVKFDTIDHPIGATVPTLHTRA